MRSTMYIYQEESISCIRLVHSWQTRVANAIPGKNKASGAGQEITVWFEKRN